MIAGLHYHSDLEAGQIAAKVAAEIDLQWHQFNEASES
jgi:hypothetical protein